MFDFPSCLLSVSLAECLCVYVYVAIYALTGISSLFNWRGERRRRCDREVKYLRKVVLFNL